MGDVAKAAREHGGFVLIHRRIFENPVFSGREWEAMAFVAMIMQAAWSPMKVRYKGKDVVLERGQLTVSVRDFAKRMDRPTTWAHRFFERLEKAGMITKKVGAKRNSTGTAVETPPAVISICNYDKFQVPLAVGETPAETGGGTQKNKGNEDKKERIPIGIPKKDRSSPWAGGDNLPAEWLAWPVSNLGWSLAQAKVEGGRFIDSALAKRRTYVDWFAAWRQWCRSPFQKTVAPQQERLTL